MKNCMFLRLNLLKQMQLTERVARLLRRLRQILHLGKNLVEAVEICEKICNRSDQNRAEYRKGKSVQ